MKKTYESPIIEKICLVSQETTTTDLSVMSNLFPMVVMDDRPDVKEL